jgi:hypothetical protein
MYCFNGWAFIISKKYPNLIPAGGEFITAVIEKLDTVPTTAVTDTEN